MQRPNDADLHWLAGLLEGEGHFGARRQVVKGKVYLYPMIQLRMTDEDIVQRVAIMFGVAANRYTDKKVKHYKPFWQISVNYMRAREWMQLLRPLMGTRRRQQIDVALQCLIKLPRKKVLSTTYANINAIVQSVRNEQSYGDAK